MDNDGWRAWQERGPDSSNSPRNSGTRSTLAFEARPGQVNEWTIPLPDELIKAVRAALKVDPAAKAKPAEPLLPLDGK